MHRINQAVYGYRACPVRRTIINDDGHHRRQFVAFFQGLGADDVLIEQAHIGHHAIGHKIVVAGLKFQQQIEIQPGVFKFQPPDAVIVTLA